MCRYSRENLHVNYFLELKGQLLASCVFFICFHGLVYQGFEDAVQDAVIQGLDDDSSELYKQVMIKTAWLAEKDLPGDKLSYNIASKFV